MIINLDELNIKDFIDINYEAKKDDKLDKRIFALEGAFVKGKITQNSNNDIILNCNFNGIMKIEDSITLELIPYEFNIDIDENLENLQENYPECYEKAKNILDLKKILWQNIVLEVPISYSLSHDANLKGNGWKLLNDNSVSLEIDPRLKKLEDLLKGDD